MPHLVSFLSSDREIDRPTTQRGDRRGGHSGGLRSPSTGTSPFYQQNRAVGAIFVLLFVLLTLPIDENMIRTLRLSPTNYETLVPAIVKRKPSLFWDNAKNRSLKIAWIMSFPNSGTSFTIKQIRNRAMVQSATNYGHENLRTTSIPVYVDMPGGPYWQDPETHPEFQFPERFVIVKTHCGLRCIQCPPERYIESIFTFREMCMTGKRRIFFPNGSIIDEETRYGEMGMNRVLKSVHLIRDPFDNVVSRFHMEMKHGKSAVGYNKTPESFRDFCFELNQKYEREEKNSKVVFHGKLLGLMEHVPCRADFIRYIEWHNHAFALSSDAQLDTLVVHYEEYAEDLDATSRRLLHFLDLAPSGQNFDFHPGKFYRDEYFDPKERRAVRDALEMAASRQSWSHIKKYFENLGGSMT